MKKEKQLFFFLLPENLNFKFCYTGVSTGCAEMFRKGTDRIHALPPPFSSSLMLREDHRVFSVKRDDEDGKSYLVIEFIR